LLSDGVTIYFAAEDENGIGGLDIYVSRYNTTTESYTTPENIGMPYNSPANEYMMIIDEVHQVGYIATDRSSKPGFVHVYSFAIPEQKQYWRNLDNNILVKYAKLLSFELYQENKEICENLTTEKMYLTTNQIVEIGDFRFVINDSIVYNSLEDFQNSEAIAKYNKWKQLEQQYQSEQQQLHLLREEYVTADNDRKKELTPAILQLEKNQSQLLIQCEKLLLTIREIENQSIQE
jgi:hypothetical protein